MKFITKYYDEDNLKIMVGINPKNDYSLEEKNDILNTNLYFWGTYDYINKEKGIGSIKVSFIHDNVVYTLNGTNKSKTKLLEIINSLHY